MTSDIAIHTDYGDVLHVAGDHGDVEIKISVKPRPDSPASDWEELAISRLRPTQALRLIAAVTEALE